MVSNWPRRMARRMLSLSSPSSASPRPRLRLGPFFLAAAVGGLRLHACRRKKPVLHVTRALTKAALD